MSQLKSNKVNVVGAGFSGLVTAYYLCRRGYQVDIYEKEDHAGGLIGTHKTSLGLIEQAANAFLATRSLEDICDEIGIGLVSVKKEASRRYLFRKGKPVRWPLSLLGSLRLFVFFIPFLFSRKLFRPSSGESLYSWSKRTMGQEAAEYLVSPAFQGIYGISAQHLSANLVLKFLFKKR
ncbi:MAG: FAD-dependent oxidoreductase, partial [Bdellovibrionales bacterium]|nr:FAD-dependent oxidoreductase [Bdellovibrionales bacterium]